MRIRKYLVGLALALAVPAASATTVFTLDTTIGTDNVSATAEFDWVGNTLFLTLTNTTDPISKTIQELTGIHFTLSGDPQLQSVSGSADGSVNCIGVAAGAPCAIDTTDVDPFGTPPNLDGQPPNPTGWASLPNFALFTFGAGGGSWKPYGIVNDSIVGSGGPSQTGNPPHNPMLLGPVDFAFVFAPFDLAPTISGVQFFWGTGGDHRTALCTENCASGDTPLPEPQTLALLGLALLGMAALRRKQRA